MGWKSFDIGTCITIVDGILFKEGYFPDCFIQRVKIDVTCSPDKVIQFPSVKTRTDPPLVETGVKTRPGVGRD